MTILWQDLISIISKQVVRKRVLVKIHVLFREKTVILVKKLLKPTYNIIFSTIPTPKSRKS